jgi:D-alanine-D-alanine ligase
VKRLRVGVLYGGRSSEHEVSLASAAAVIANLDRARYEPVPIRIERDGRWTLADRPPTAISAAHVIEQARVEAARPVRGNREVHLIARPSEETILTIERRPPGREAQDGGDGAVVTGLGLDLIFPVLHGPYGEDGTVQGLLELANVPYVGAGVLASAAGMDKGVMKVLFAARALPIVEHVVVPRREWLADRARVSRAILTRLGLPVFVKPANLGSSIGISKIADQADLGAAMDLAAEYDRKLIVEAAVPDAREIECAVLGNDEPAASVPGEIVPSREFYDYEAKYLDADSQLLIPAPLPADLAAEIRRLAIEAFTAIDGAGMARVDFLLARRTSRVYVNEVNTIPGFTTISMYAKLWAASGIDYPALLDRLVALALERHAEKQQLRTSLT